MANANRGLGRGLGALLGDAALQTESADSLYLPHFAGGELRRSAAQAF